MLQGAAGATMSPSNLVARAYTLADEYMKQSGGVDYDELRKENTKLRAKLREGQRYVIMTNGEPGVLCNADDLNTVKANATRFHRGTVIEIYEGDDIVVTRNQDGKWTQ